MKIFFNLFALLLALASFSAPANAQNGAQSYSPDVTFDNTVIDESTALANEFKIFATPNYDSIQSAQTIQSLQTQLEEAQTQAATAKTHTKWLGLGLAFLLIFSFIVSCIAIYFNGKCKELVVKSTKEDKQIEFCYSH